MNELKYYINRYSTDGGLTGQHPKYTLREWKHEVSWEDTRLGYWEWCYNKESEDSGR